MVSGLHEIHDIAGPGALRQPEPIERVQVGAYAFGSARIALSAGHQFGIDALQSALDRDARITLPHSLPERLGVSTSATTLTNRRNRRDQWGAPLLTQFDDDRDLLRDGGATRVLRRVRHTWAPSRCTFRSAEDVPIRPRSRSRHKTHSA